MIDLRHSICFLLAIVFVSTCKAQSTTASINGFMQSHCIECHGPGNQEGRLDLESLLTTELTDKPQQWEAVVSKLAARQMPPVGSQRPSEEDYRAVLKQLTESLDSFAASHPNPGRTETFRRLTQNEYRNAIRDLLELDVDVSEMLPADESSHGFDNVTVTGLSPVALDRYVSASQKISRLAIGVRAEPAAEKTYRIAPDVTQDVHLEGTPLGTRGGKVVEYNFPQDGEYEVQAWLMRDRNEELEGMRGEHQLQVILDRAEIASFTIKPPPQGVSDKIVDENLKTKVQVTAGPHQVGVVFVAKPSSVLETIRQPLNVHFNYYRHPRIGPAIYQMTIRGPFNGTTAKDTPSREKVFVCYPQNKDEDDACADKIIATFMERAYRRTPTAGDIESAAKFYREGREQAGFDAGIEKAISSILVSPHFLFRIEHDPSELANDTVYQISPIELANRLSFFIWNSVPDDDLRQAAISGELANPEVLETQVRRMLKDDRASAMIRNFAGQWLYLRNLEAVIPDMRLYPDFDDNLRQAFRSETEMFVENVVHEDRSVLDLITADYSYLNERLAKHYGIDHVYGSHFRRVSLDKSSHRGGLLRHGSILSVTSYATRTSPVIRGHWVLKNIIGNPPPPPPPNVPTLDDNTVSTALPLRQRLSQHRANEACAVCHDLMDPVGFALENYDAVGRWREMENGEQLETSGAFADGSEFVGVDGLEQVILKRPELFVQTLSEKLMTFALGRGVEYYDMPAIRKVVHQAEPNNYRFSDIVVGIASSVPFQMRKTP